jgi:glycosyltransferase involved in cell wall biosynthesis
MDEPGGHDIDVSVIVPAYHGEATIAKCLKSIDQSTQGRSREIIVVDSSASDETAKIVSRFPEVILIRSKERLSAGAARNRGRQASRGRLVFFTDQDCIVPADWVDRLEKYLQDPGVGAAGGAVGIQDLWNWTGCAVYFLEFLTHFPGVEPARLDANFLVGCNFGSRAELFKVARFPDRTLAEDILFSNSVHKSGFHTIYDSRVVVLHKNRTGLKTFFQYNYKMGRAAAGYHQILRLRWAAPVLRWPLLAFFTPIAVLPRICISLLRSPWSYLLRFLLLAPLCLSGNLVWASGFRREVLDTRFKTRSSQG